MGSKITFDLCIIGAGAAGCHLAEKASQLGIKVAIVEANKAGGNFLYSAIASKSFIACAKKYYQAKNSKKYGFVANPEKVEISHIMTRVKSAIRQAKPKFESAHFLKLGINFFEGSARFINKNQLMVNDTLISAKYFVITTGSKPYIPDTPGLETINYLTDETIFNLDITPKHLLIIGGGPIACELAQGFAMLGIRVTQIVRGQILSKEEPDLVKKLRKDLLDMGVSLFENSWVGSLHPCADVIEVFIKDSDKNEL